MKKFAKIFVAVAALFTGVACTTDVTEDLGVNLGDQTTLTLSLEESRTQLGAEADGIYPVTWSAEDQISVNGVASSTIAISSNASVAAFSFSEPLNYPYEVAYPAAAAGKVVFAAEQTHTENTFANGAAVMYGYAESAGALSLKHLTGVLKFGVKGTATLKKVQVSTVNAPIAGEFDIDFTTGEVTPAEGAKRVITYSFGEGVRLSTTPTYLHIAVPAGVYNLLHVTLYDSEGGVMTATVKANDEKPLKAGGVRNFTNAIVYEANTADFLVSSYEDLTRLVKAIEGSSELEPFTQNVLLTENVVIPADAEWVPIEGFTNTFNGNGFEISGLKNSLFGTLEGATVKNLAINIDIAVEDTRSLVGGLANIVKSTADRIASVDNCSASGKLTINSTFAGDANTGFSGNDDEISFSPMVARLYNANVTNCVNNASIDVKSISSVTTVAIKPCVAGVIGVVKSISELKNTSVVTDCVNSKSATIVWNEDAPSSSMNSYVGGVVGGYLVDGTAKNLKNYADITILSQTHVPNIGGVVGYFMASSGSHLYNYGNVTIDAQTSYCYWGGVLGSVYTDVTSLTYCENHGDVTFGKNASCSHRNYQGGVIGTSQTPNAVYSDLKNLGTIGNYGTNSKTRLWVGGIIAYSWKVAKIENCVNGEKDTEKGKIIIEGSVGLDATYYPGIGGICGCAYPQSGEKMISGCTNYAPIVAAYTTTSTLSQCIGGIVGWARASITNGCKNYGAIDCSNLNNEAKVQMFIAGVAAYASDAGVASSDNHNYANITVGDKVNFRLQLGGVFGLNSHGVSNCSNSGKLTVNGSPSIVSSATGSIQASSRTDADVNNRSNIGGVVGKIYNTAVKSSILSLTNTGEIHLPQADSIRCTAIGGVLGEATLSEMTISSLSNSGDIKVENVNNKAMLNSFGGIIGRNFNMKVSSQKVSISDCTNTGDISLVEKTATNHVRAGGIVGDLLSAGSSKLEAVVTISNCTNSGNISRTTTTKTASSQSYAGGIVGAVGGKPGSANESLMGTALTISGCENSGSIQFEQFNGTKALDNTADCNAFGGIIGMMYGGLTNSPSKAYVPEVVSCVNKGTVSSYAGAVGGIVGLLYDWGVVNGTESAYNINEGEVKLLGTSNGYAGGVVGYIHLVDAANTKMTCTYSANKGAVSGNKYVGGIVGFSGIATADQIANCVNVGSVTGAITTGTKDAKYAGFVGGIVGSAAANILSCTNFAVVKGLHYANLGVITGSARSEAVVAKDCKVGGHICFEQDENEEFLVDDVLIAITSSNYFEYIYGTTTDWTNVEKYDGCTVVTEAPKL